MKCRKGVGRAGRVAEELGEERVANTGMTEKTVLVTRTRNIST